MYLAALGTGVVLGLLAMMVFAWVAQAGLRDRVAGFVTGRPASGERKDDGAVGRLNYETTPLSRTWKGVAGPALESLQIHDFCHCRIAYGLFHV